VSSKAAAAGGSTAGTVVFVLLLLALALGHGCVDPGRTRSGRLRGPRAGQGTVLYMSEVMARRVVAMDPEQVQSLNEQVDRLDPDEPYMVVVVDGRVYVRSTRGLPRALIQLWRRNPTMMVPDTAGYRAEVLEVEIADL